jgi:hypothetical protein
MEPVITDPNDPNYNPYLDPNSPDYDPSRADLSGTTDIGTVSEGLED